MKKPQWSLKIENGGKMLLLLLLMMMILIITLMILTNIYLCEPEVIEDNRCR